TPVPVKLNLGRFFKEWRSLLLALLFLGGVVFITREKDPRDCREMSGCKAQGLCTGDPDHCEAGDDEDCRNSQACLSAGRCKEKNGRCVVTDDWCKKRDACKTSGLCVALVESQSDRCAAT